MRCSVGPFGYMPQATFFPGSGFNFEPPVDIYTTDNEVSLYATLPGFKPEEINVEATVDTITVCGERKSLYDSDRAVADKQTGLMEETKFHIQCSLPAEVDPNKITSTLHNGVLHLQMPKTESAKTKSVKVPVKAA